ncbi:MAG: hypothetical protein HY319_10745 [Armatimonadetes bacterium]|nr:hypothetical protein [Armatimonadota bacterium]
MMNLLKALCLSLLVLLTAALAGCRESAIGVVPLQAATISGTVVDTPESSVLLRTDDNVSFLVPADAGFYAPTGSLVGYDSLLPGTAVSVSLPADQGRLIAYGGEVLTLDTPLGVTQLPVSALPASTLNTTYVQILDVSGQRQVVALEQALYMQRYSGATILAAPGVSRDHFVAYEPGVLHRGVLIGSIGQDVLVASPVAGSTRVVRLPATYASSFRSYSSGTPVRFALRDPGADLAVSIWSAPDPGSIDLARTLLAGKLLGLLPDGVLVEAMPGQTLLYPRNLVYYEQQPLTLVAPALGSPVNVIIPSGLVHTLGCQDGLVSFYDERFGVLQLPEPTFLRKAPSRCRVHVLKPNGKVVNVPLQAALNMQRAQGAVILPSRFARARILGSPRGLAAGQGVVLCTQQDQVLFSSLVNGRPQIVSLSQNRIGKLKPGKVVRFTSNGVAPLALEKKVRTVAAHRDRDDDRKLAGRDDQRHHGMGRESEQQRAALRVQEEEKDTRHEHAASAGRNQHGTEQGSVARQEQKPGPHGVARDKSREERLGAQHKHRNSVAHRERTAGPGPAAQPKHGAGPARVAQHRAAPPPVTPQNHGAMPARVAQRQPEPARRAAPPQRRAAPAAVPQRPPEVRHQPAPVVRHHVPRVAVNQGRPAQHRQQPQSVRQQAAPQFGGPGQHGGGRGGGKGKR